MVEREIRIQIRRPGIDKHWQDAPYDVQDEDRAKRLMKWLRGFHPQFEFRIVRLETV